MVNEKTDKRTLLWLWMYINKFYAAQEIGPYGNPKIIEKIQAALKQIPQEEIDQQLKSTMIIAPYYNWVSDDPAQLQWLTERLIKATQAPQSIQYSMRCDRDYVIGLFDLLGTLPRTIIDATNINNHIKKTLEQKKKSVLYLKKEWEIFSQPNKILEWFNDDQDPVKLKAASQIFNKQFPHFTSFLSEFSNFAEMVDTFERNQIPTAERLIFLSAAKRKASKLRHKENNKDKKVQCNLDISLTAKARLKKLAAKHRISQANVIEFLIQKEFEKSSTFPEVQEQIRRFK